MFQQITFMQQMMMGVAQMHALFNQMQPQPPMPPPPPPVDVASNSTVADGEESDSASGSDTNDDEGEAGSAPRPGWELGGKVEGAAKTAGEKRRIRKKRLKQMHYTMQRGKFWEIREMQKERYGF